LDALLFGDVQELHGVSTYFASEYARAAISTGRDDVLVARAEPRLPNLAIMVAEDRNRAAGCYLPHASSAVIACGHS
jgi:hypothetical protein